MLTVHKIENVPLQVIKLMLHQRGLGRLDLVHLLALESLKVTAQPTLLTVDCRLCTLSLCVCRLIFEFACNVAYSCVTDSLLHASEG